jgi:nicotinate dehydrogenase subunit B
VPWTEDEFFAYLSTGQSRHHGVAAGPMAEVVAELAAVPAADLRAMAHYLASLAGDAPADADAVAARTQARADAVPVGVEPAGARLYEGACAVCHEAGAPAGFGARPALALNTNVHARTPDNLIRVVLDGIAAPAHADLGAMPGFAGSFSDAQVADLLRYVRARFAPDAPAWTGIEQSVARIRR